MYKAHQAQAEFALRAVRQAANLGRQIQQEMVSPALTKADRSPVTIADYTSQAVIARMLQQTFPGDPLVAEEGSQQLQEPQQERTLAAVTAYVGRIFPQASDQDVCSWIDLGGSEPSDRFWTLDPIDGTKGFLRGEQYVVALALIEGGKVVLAALGAPNLSPTLEPDIGGPGTTVLAVRECGAWVYASETETAIRLEVSSRQDPHAARILRSVEASHTDAAKVGRLRESLGTKADPVLMDSQAKFAILASGGAELIFRLLSPRMPDYREWIWDQAAGSLIVEEAGGEVSDLRGRPLDFSSGRRLERNFGVLVSNRWLHPVALDAIRSVGADQRPEPA